MIQYGSVLGLIVEALQDGPDDQLRLITLIRLSTLFLREAPERELIVQGRQIV